MSMFNSARIAVGAVALAVVAPLGFAAGSAEAAPTAASSITVKASDTTPASGQTFTISGLFTDQGHPADHETVRVAALKDGSWVRLTGAHMLTDSTGHYQMRLVLQTKGVRDLRVAGIVPGAAPDAFKRFTVTVH